MQNNPNGSQTVETDITKSEAIALGLVEHPLCQDLAGCEYPKCDCRRVFITPERFETIYPRTRK